MKLTNLFTVCCFEVLVSMIGVHAQPRYRMMVDPPIEVNDPPPTAPFVVLCFREQGSMSTDAADCPLGVQTYVPNGADQPPETLENFTPGTDSIPPAYPTEGNITILGVGLLVTFQDNGTDSLASHIFTQIGGEAPGTLFTIDSTQIEGTGIVFTITIGAICLEEDTGVDCNTPPVAGTTEITTTGEQTTVTAETSTPLTEEVDGTDNQCTCIVPIASGIGWGVASLLLNVILTVVLITVVLKRRNKGGQSGEYKEENRGEIPMTRNTVYGAHHNTATETTEEIDTSRNPVYGMHDSKTNTGQDSQEHEKINTGQDSQEYEDVWLH